jgi:hypothetical protein
MADTIKYVAVEVAGKPSPSKLLHREDCGHLRDAAWPEPVLRAATDGELRSRRKCRSCLAQEARELGR